MSSNDKSEKRKVDDMLREAGYERMPRTWIKAEDMPLVDILVRKVKKEVYDIQVQTRHHNHELEKRLARETEETTEKFRFQNSHEPDYGSEQDPMQIDWPGMN